MWISTQLCCNGSLKSWAKTLLNQALLPCRTVPCWTYPKLFQHVVWEIAFQSKTVDTSPTRSILAGPSSADHFPCASIRFRDEASGGWPADVGRLAGALSINLVSRLWSLERSCGDQSCQVRHVGETFGTWQCGAYERNWQSVYSSFHFVVHLLRAQESADRWIPRAGWISTVTSPKKVKSKVAPNHKKDTWVV